MSDNKKYYYIKIKDNFYDTDDIKLLQSMDNGYLYSDILMKLYLKSLKYNGKLMFKDHIPFNAKMIATITCHNIAIVEKALSIFAEIGLIEILDNGAIYMLDIQNFIGQSSTEADRKKEYRQRIAIEKNKLLPEGEDICPDICPQREDKIPPEIEIRDRDKDKEIDIELDNSISKDILVPKDLVPIQEAWNSLGLSKINSIKGNRLKLLKARIKEYGIDTILKSIESIRNSSFLKGQNKTGWVIVFDWFIKPNNFPKVLEGNYTDKEGSYGNYNGSNKENNADYTEVKRQADIHAPGPTEEELRRAEEEGLFD